MKKLTLLLISAMVALALPSCETVPDFSPCLNDEYDTEQKLTCIGFQAAKAAVEDQLKKKAKQSTK